MRVTTIKCPQFHSVSFDHALLLLNFSCHGSDRGRGGGGGGGGDLKDGGKKEQQHDTLSFL